MQRGGNKRWRMGGLAGEEVSRLSGKIGEGEGGSAFEEIFANQGSLLRRER